MSVARILLGKYRELIYFLRNKEKHGIMSGLHKCSISCCEDIPHYQDVVHPSVRKGGANACNNPWWMVYTPYYKANDHFENPILSYAEDSELIKWKVLCRVVEQPRKGYNSDPALFFDGDTCMIYWREVKTERTDSDSCVTAVYAKSYDKAMKDIEFPMLKETKEFEDRLVSPAFIRHDGVYYAYAMHLKFKNEKFILKNHFLNGLVSKMLLLSSLLYLYNQQKSIGISVWKTDSLYKSFRYVKTGLIKNKNPLYIPWHLDVFEYENKLYAVIQTNQCNADIVLAVSDDFENFEIYPHPLLTSYDLNIIGKTGLYKPTAFVEEGIFNLYVSLQDTNDRDSNSLYKLEMPFIELLKLASK